MLKNKDTAMNAATEAVITLTEPALDLAAYYLFLVGMTLCSLGMYSVGLACVSASLDPHLHCLVCPSCKP